MKKVVLPVILCLVFIGIAGTQFYENYKFRVQPPSSEWSKDVVISKGNLKNTPKIVKFQSNYVIAHDDGGKIKILIVDKLGKKLIEKEFPGEDNILFDLNLLTDGKSIYTNWLCSKGNTKDLYNLKLDNSLTLLDKWKIEDVRSSIQISDSIYVMTYGDKIGLHDFLTGRDYNIDAKLASKLCSTKINNEYMIAYYDNSSFKYITYDNNKIDGPKLIMRRPLSTREMFIKTALACDDKNGYIFIDRKYKTIFGQGIIISFPLKETEEQQKHMTTYAGDVIEIGNGVERGLRLSTETSFTYNPISVSSGNEARFLIGAPRPYGKSERQFDIMDFNFKDGKLVDSTYIDNSREGSTMPWIVEDMVVYCKQKSLDQYEVCLTSQNAEFKNKANVVKGSEIRLAFIDTLSDLADSIFGIFTIGLKWIIPGLVLISIITLFGYKLTEKAKILMFIGTCLLTSFMKIINAKSLFYSIYGYMLPKYLSSMVIGIIVCFIISLLAYLNGYNRYTKKLLKNPDVMPIFPFVIALFTDSILTQFLFTPFIM